eukprot:gnl/MRDRNA2_/MRDRNA2_71897_c0_seq1.p2 gnl/MRDRNA2_/MRDRNA2_71897_c0~~gnl/MRDRNA2_/MRDRNA2_71897_c0_seq1.p2  ORF type:complete len:109 (+),score=12.95 gnl/MRDRNA2_/MRDRNA2_71897_c0_seq1:102-428(+)
MDFGVSETSFDRSSSLRVTATMGHITMEHFVRRAGHYKVFQSQVAQWRCLPVTKLGLFFVSVLGRYVLDVELAVLSLVDFFRITDEIGGACGRSLSARTLEHHEFASA